MYSRTFLLELYRTLYRIRTFENRCVRLYREGLIRGYFHPYLGEEAIAAGACAALKAEDYIVSTHRGHGHCIARGARFDRMAAELFGRETGYCLGLGGSMHIADLKTGNLGANGIVGGGIAMGVGAALGAALRGEDRVAVIFFSDGASNNGIFGEALNLAAVYQAPAIFMLENNQYAVCTPVAKSCRSADLYRIGAGYAVESSMVDGNDPLAVYEKTCQARALCRTGKGPVLIEAKTYRQGGHHVNDPGQYMLRDRVEYYKEHDPVKIGREHALTLGRIPEVELATLETQVQAEMDEAIAFARRSPEMGLEKFVELTAGY